MFKYSSSSISEAVEVGIVAIGPVANICVFLVMAMFGSAFYKVRLSWFDSRFFFSYLMLHVSSFLVSFLMPFRSSLHITALQLS
jgi:hypothetical protein